MAVQDRKLTEHLKKTNCVWVAWEQFVYNESPAMVLVWSPYSKWHKFAHRRWWRMLVQPVGYFVTRMLWWMLSWWCVWTTGRWMHARFVDPVTGTQMEFLPNDVKHQRWIMPDRQWGHIAGTGKRCE